MPLLSERLPMQLASVLQHETNAEWDYSKNIGTISEYTTWSHAKIWWHDDKQGSFLAAGGSSLKPCIFQLGGGLFVLFC